MTLAPGLSVPRRLGLVCAIAAAALLHSGEHALAAPPQLPDQSQITAVPLGHVVGTAQDMIDINNPFKGDKNAIAEGKRLFVVMNCAGCHGYDGTGGMGPDLTDRYWRYGGTPVAIFRSIADGRPQGMPSWGMALPPGEIWKIVAFLETLGGSYPSTQYSASMQGDHSVTFVAPQLRDLEPGFNKTDVPGTGAPITPASTIGATGGAPELAPSAARPLDDTVAPAARPNGADARPPPLPPASAGGIGSNSSPPGPAAPGSFANKPTNGSSAKDPAPNSQGPRE